MNIQLPNKLKIVGLVKSCISIASQDWNNRESSWDYERHGLLISNIIDIEESYDLYQQYWQNKFYKLKDIPSKAGITFFGNSSLSLI